MPSRGGYAARSPSHRGDRFHNPSAIRLHQQILLLQQQQQEDQQMLQRQMLHHHHQQLHNQQHRQIQRKPMVKPESSFSGAMADIEKQSEKNNSSMAVTLSIPQSIAPTSPLRSTNLDRLKESVTPFISARFSSEVNVRGWSTSEMDSLSFFILEDLWEVFQEWSAYGVGVPLLLNGKYPIDQYYVPFLSGIQLYKDPSKTSCQLRAHSEENDGETYRLTSCASNNDSKAESRTQSTLDFAQRLNMLSFGDKSVDSMISEAESAISPISLMFEFLEYDQPYNRKPLSDKISELASQFPELSTCRSCDLHPSSWICVAWYPIYRIPMGSTLQDLEASFLTFHFLSTQSISNHHPQFHAANTRNAKRFVDPIAKISLPVFALASYKLKGSIVSPCGPHECEQENSLFRAADDWLRKLQVALPDYQFFHTHYYRER